MAFFSATLLGVRPIPVEIEIDLSSGLPFFQIVGLPDAVLRESKTRVKSAIMQGGFDFPYDQRVVLNLAPSKVKKEGSGFELGLAARILASSGQIPMPDSHVLFLGELALDGSVRSVPEIDALSFAAHPEFSRGQKVELVVVSNESVDSLAHLGIPVFGINHLSDLRGKCWWTAAKVPPPTDNQTRTVKDFHIKNFSYTKFWGKHLLAAAVGGHHYFLCGPPGCGKTFFAESLQMLLCALKSEGSVERQLLNAIFNRSKNEFPWASPHHSASMAGLIGGGNPPRPGALTRAHGGILFLDELLEFSPSSLDSLREPLERGVIEIYRAGHHVSFPSRFQLVGATNPCRCGFFKSTYKQCDCPQLSRKAYRSRMSGPFFDRFDIKLTCASPQGNEEKVSGKEIYSRAQSLLREKMKPAFDSDAEKALFEKIDRMKLNYRAQSKVRRVAITLAQLEGVSGVRESHIAEACDLQDFKGLDGPA